jgi:uncharacterized protein YjeT (DUF2065 family)
MTPERLDTIASLVGARLGLAGLLFTIGPRWSRRLLEDFARLTDDEMRIIGYVLIGSAAVIFAQQAAERVVTSRIAALAGQRTSDAT